MRKALSILASVILLQGIPALAQSVGTFVGGKYQIPFPKELGENKDTVSMMIIGDVMMHTKQLSKDCHLFLKHISKSMNDADIMVANMEFTLGGEPYSGYPAFSTPDSYIHYLVEDCGTDVILAANNHILDRGAAGLKRTIGVYSSLRDSIGVKYTGIASDSEDLDDNYPLIIFRKGIKLALVNFTYGTNIKSSAEWPKVNYMSKPDVENAIEEARESGADFVIAVPHWGNEYQLRHSSQQEEWAEWLVDQGVDAIVGAHPHVVQDSTHIKGVPVIYSVGNAVSNMSATNTRLELAVTLRFTVDRYTGEKEMLEPELDFLWCTLPGMLTDNYATIYVKEWANRRDEWLTPSDFDNMVETLRRVKAATGISGD